MFTVALILRTFHPLSKPCNRPSWTPAQSVAQPTARANWLHHPLLNQATLCLRATASHTCTCTLSHPTHPTPSCASAKRSLHALGSQKHDVTASHSVLQRPTGHVFHLFPSPQPAPMAYVACTSALHPSLLPKSPGEGGTSSRLLPLADRGWMRSQGSSGGFDWLSGFQVDDWWRG